MQSNYDKNPIVEIKGISNCAWQGYADIIGEIKSRIGRSEKTVVVLDCYHGVYHDEILNAFENGLNPDTLIDVADANLSNAEIEAMLQRNITEDRVFGVLSHHMITEFFDDEKLAALGREIENAKGVVLVYGTGAALAAEADILIYADLVRWEIQQRFRSNTMGNWCTDNANEETLRKYKRAFFIDWRVIDRHKKKLMDKIDYLLDTNKKDNPKMLTGEAFREGLRQTAEQPFRVVPYFDPGVWGGQWMKKVCGLDPEKENFAWCFDGVPEENSLLLSSGGIVVEVPAINAVFYRPVQLLGDKVHARFGTEFPIRFDFLDTMEGGNLSLQVHPLTEYIQEHFGMHYTQDESYYILDAKEDAAVYLGIRDGVDKEDFEQALRESTETGSFDAECYINKFPAKKHDHFLIPAGTTHCSGSNAMVLEISATPYIFTFKLWDWGRLGLDGRPRPIHLEHGMENIQFDRRTEWVRENLINCVTEIESGDGFVEERTGLHEREFIETRRHWFTKPVEHDTNGGVNMLNLIEGEEAVITSPENRFAPFILHYAETCIIPAAVGKYTISPYGKSAGKKLATIKAYVRVV